MKVYIAGPMTGLPHHNFPAFFMAEQRLIRKGFSPVNPARMVFSDSWTTALETALALDWSWEQWIERDMKLLSECEAVWMLEGWENSKGAKIEYETALATGKKVFFDLVGENA